MPRLKNSRRVGRRGLSLIELLVSLTILLVIMVGVAGLLESSWQSFSDLKWQNRVDSEARRALDAVSDSVRMSGQPVDFYNYFTKRSGDPYAANIIPSSTGTALNVNNEALESYYLSDYNINGNDIGYLARDATQSVNGGSTMGAVYISGINFAYEYREVSKPGDTQWTFDTVQGIQKNKPATDPTNGVVFYTVKTVYITVTASFNPYPGSIDSRTYTRTLTGAVTLRQPYDMPLPPAQIDGP